MTIGDKQMDKLNTPSISSSSMIVELNVSLWTGRKLDRAVSDEIDITKHTTTRAGNYHKKLFADEPRFEAIQKQVGMARTYHYARTMPWSDGGQRLLTTPLYFDYNSYMTNEQMRFYELVETCLNDWDNMLQRAQVKLGRLFNPDDYPSKDDIRSRYAFNIKYSPVPEVGDFRVDVGNEALRYLQDSYEESYKAQIETAYKDVWTRLHESLSNMSERLAGEKKQVFRDSLVSNVRDIVGLLSAFNITDDPKMREAERKINFALLGVTPDSLREDTEFRLETKQKVDELLKEFAW
jgi:hypothetical protein